jgi:cytoskeletal protein CcmA (bactofilin family)
MPAKNDGAATCIIGQNSVFEGKFFVVGSILIEGKFEGEIRTEEQLTIGPTGKVKTDIFARRVIVGGTLIGNIDATEEVTLLQNGKVLGNITTPKLNVEDGVIVHGVVTINNGRSDEVAQIIKESFGEEAESLFAASEKVTRKEKIRDTREAREARAE